MKLWTLLLKLMTIDSQTHGLQSESEPFPTTADRKPDLRNDSTLSARPLKDQKLLALYKVMDMGA